MKKMIRQDEVMDLLRACCPAFEERWKEHLQYWGNEERGIFNDTGEFAHFVVDSYSKNDTSFFPALFDILEKIINDGDEKACAAATVGILESIHTISSNREFGPDPFERWLRPKSLAFWRENEKLWDASGGSLAGIVRAQKQSKSSEEN